MSTNYIRKSLRENIHNRANHICEYCHVLKSYGVKTFEIEHIIPIKLKGKSILENLALACGGCNSFKSSRVTGIDPIERDVFPLYNPRIQDWMEHFQWNDDFTLIIGITPVGRATVSTLKMNRKELINLRLLLQIVKKHPPKYTFIG